MIKATIKPRESDRVGTYRGKTLDRGYVILDRDTGRAIVTARVYYPGSVARACVWITGGGVYASGAGRAGGGGYCKESAAIGAALSDAGVTLSEPIGGRGTRAVEEALEAVARAVTGKRKFYKVLCHA